MQEAEKKSDARAGEVAPKKNLGATGKVNVEAQSNIADLCFDLWLAEKSGGKELEIVNTLVAALKPHAAVNGLLGVLGKCQISGCDVHVLTLQNEIVRHLALDAATPDGFSSARAYWQAPHAAAIAVLVYSDYSDVLLIDGSVMRLM